MSRECMCGDGFGEFCDWCWWFSWLLYFFVVGMGRIGSYCEIGGVKLLI